MSAGVVRFDRGTLEVEAVPEVEGVLWDPRTETERAAAFRFSELAAAADAAGTQLVGDLRAAWPVVVRSTATLELRDYQVQALAAWRASSARGIVVLPTGAGKTRVAIAAMLETGLPTAVLCPTRALAAAWTEQLALHTGERIGLFGDGERRLERVTVMTFESAFRHLDRHGDKFGLLVVDEVHHFGSGARIEALEASAAVARLGLTATAPDTGSEPLGRLERVVGPIVFEMTYGELVGRHLAPLGVVRIPARLSPDEQRTYDDKMRLFREMQRAFFRIDPGADLATMMKSIGATADGRRALRERARAVALASFPVHKAAIVRQLLERHRGDKTIVFTAYAENAYAVALDNLVPVIAGETRARERREILERFRDGRVRAVAAARVLNEGIDVPEARVAIIVAGALGRREHVQRIGRVLRPSPNKTALVYELVTTGTTDARRAYARARHAPERSPRLPARG